MIYVVTAVIQSQNLDENRPCPVQWYKGDNLAKAVHALTGAAVHDEDLDHEGLPESMRYRTLSVELTKQEA